MSRGAAATPTAGAADSLESFVSVLQLSDSAFPSGRYTLSYGLEPLLAHGLLRTPASGATLVALLADTIRFGVAPSDGLALACTHRAVGLGASADLELITEVDHRLTAVKIPREARQASTRTGRAVLATATATVDVAVLGDYAQLVREGRSPGNHAVAVGLLSSALGVPCPEAVTGELYAFCAGWAAAAVRLGLVDHRGAQGLLHRTRSVIADAALDVLDGDVDRISSCTPLLDVMAMRHEQAELRLFAT